ncbi:DMT family transporter [Chitinophaga sp. Cy-1792]|uniref:EamA family transporter n=1 Tax=Chitinophaga sp. Cy-1792 TaxID=2608339 RepID=UPI0014206EBB|nr:DMT family transporter [Chitinophaga sp. Cy-1792]NIG56408.1 DMT family transporter [Chitinophaga sp. Cy-1792]
MVRYILMVLGGAVSFGILSSFVKLAYQHGYNTAQISFLQALIGAIVLWIVFVISKRPAASRKQVPLLLMTGATIGVATFLYYLSVKFIPASVAIVLLMQFTWIGILIEWIFFKKKPSLTELFIAAVILSGTIMASGSSLAGGMSLSVKGVLIVLAASLVYAAYIVANSRIGRDICWQNKSAWIMTGAAAAIWMMNIKSVNVHLLMEMDLLRWCIFLAFFGTILPPILFAIGIPKVGATVSSLLMTVELPVAALSAHFILGEQITELQLAGIAIMLVAIMSMNFIRSARQKKEMAATA